MSESSEADTKAAMEYLAVAVHDGKEAEPERSVHTSYVVRFDH